MRGAVVLLAGGFAIGAAACGAGGASAPDAAGTMQGGQDAAPRDLPAPEPDGPSCPAPTGAGTTHASGNVADDEIWSVADSPHIVNVGTGVAAGATLTIEPCATVLLGDNVTITVRGTLVAEGTDTRPILIGAVDPAKPWAQIRALAGGRLRFVWTTLKDGGNPGNTPPHLFGMLDVRGDQYLAPQEVLHVDQVHVVGSRSVGVLLREGGGFSQASTWLMVENAAVVPVSLWASLATNLPVGDYKENPRPEIQLHGAGGFDAVTRDTILRSRGVPYRVGAPGGTPELRVGPGADNTLATLTIEAGTTIRFEAGGSLHVEYSAGTNPATAALVAEGTAQDPVVFTSAAASPAPGDWIGLRFGQVPSPANRLEHVRIEYAGGHTTSGSSSCPHPIETERYRAAIRIFSGQPAASFLINSTIIDSAGHGVERGWRGGLVDFLPTNTFTRVAWCQQTFPGDANGSCQADPPCPM